MAAGDHPAIVQAEIHKNKPYDESLEIPDAEEVKSVYTPSPRTSYLGKTMDNSDDDDNIVDSEAANNNNSSRPVPSLERIRPTGPLKAVGGEEEEQQNMLGGPDSDEDDEEDDDDDDSEPGLPPGAYDPSEYDHLVVSSDIKELFQYITRYTPQTIDLETALKPFIPDYIPAVGDIDAFVKVPRPDGKNDDLGLMVLDEPCIQQSEPAVLDLMLRAHSKQSASAQATVNSLANANCDSKALDNWIKSIADLHRMKPPPTVNYSRAMPEIDQMMSEWPPQFEELLKDVDLPTADMEMSLSDYVDLICTILDIPVTQSRIQSLHLLFTVYSEFRNSEHFKALADENRLENRNKRAGDSNRDSTAGVDRLLVE